MSEPPFCVTCSEGGRVRWSFGMNPGTNEPNKDCPSRHESSVCVRVCFSRSVGRHALGPVPPAAVGLAEAALPRPSPAREPAGPIQCVWPPTVAPSRKPMRTAGRFSVGESSSPRGCRG